MQSKIFLSLLFILSGTPFLEAKKTKLYKAVEANNISLVKELISKGSSVNEQNLYKELWADWDYKDDRLTPLFAAIDKRNKEMVELLLKHGANPDAQGNQYGYTSTLQVAAGGDADILAMLLDRGAYLDYDRALYTAARKGLQENFDLLLVYLDEFIKQGKIPSKESIVTKALFTAIENKNLNLVHLFADMGASLDYALKASLDPVQITDFLPLSFTILLERNANPNSQDSAGNTTLHDIKYRIASIKKWFAKDSVSNYHKELAILSQAEQTLLRYGASSDIKNKDGKIPSDI
jgi:ankyrin repeat protein